MSQAIAAVGQIQLAKEFQNIGKNNRKTNLFHQMTLSKEKELSMLEGHLKIYLN